MRAHGTKFLAIAAIFAASAVVTTGILTPAGAAPAGGQTLIFRVSLTRQKRIDATPTGFSPGDQLIFYGAYHRGSRRVGGDRESCLLIQLRPALLTCQFAARVPGGQLVAEGKFDPTHLPWTIPVVGGTGRFVGASGTLTSSDGARDSERFTFRLLP